MAGEDDIPNPGLGSLLPGEAPRASASSGGPSFRSSSAVREFEKRVRDVVSPLASLAKEAKAAVGELKKLRVGGGSPGTPGAGSGSYTAGHMNFGSMGSFTPSIPPGASSKVTSRFGGLRRGVGGAFGRMWDPDGPGGQPMDAAARVQVGQQIGQIAGQLGGGMNRYFVGATANATVLDWAATQRTQLQGRYQEGKRETYNRWQSSYGNVRGWNDLQDLSQGSMLNNRISGGSMSSLRQIGIGGMLNPTIGMAGSAQAYSQMLQPGAINAMIPFGGGAVANGGRRRQMDEMLGQYAMTATGTTGFGKGRGKLNAGWARDAFREGGQGRQNLRQLGMSEDMIDMVMTYSTQSATAGRALDLDKASDVRLGGFNASFQHNAQIKAQRKGQTDVRVFEDSRDTQMNWNDLMGKANQVLGEFIDKMGAASALFGAGKVGGMIGGLGQSGLLGLGLNAALGGGGGGGISGMLGKMAGRAALGGVGGVAAGAGLAGLGGLAGYGVGSAVSSAIPKNSGWQRGLGGATKWGATGAGLGAGIGAIFGGVGAAPGAAIGGAIGAVGGGIAGLFGVGDAVLPGRGKTTGLNASFLDRLKQMFAANPNLQLSSGFRSRNEQQALWDARGSNPYPVAKPGTSRHESGVAADVGPQDQLAWVRQNAPKFGLTVPMPDKDPVHVELAGAQPLVQDNQSVVDEPYTALGAAGLYSALAAAVGGLSSSGISVGGRSATGAVRFGGGGGGSIMAAAGSAAGGVAAGAPASRTDLIALLRNAGFEGEGLRLAYAVMMAESGGNPGAHNPNAGTGDNSYGLFQINMIGNLGPARRKQYNLANNEALFDAATNASVANQMSADGTNWQPWSTYKNNDYKKFYDPGLGDAVGGGGVAGGSRVSMSRSITIQQVVLKVELSEVNEAEARRLGDLFMAAIDERTQHAAMGSS